MERPQSSKSSRADENVARALEEGDIGLVSTAWLLAQPADYRIERRQALEARAAAGEAPLLSFAKAAELIRRARREIGVLTYGWLSPGNPDVEGARLAVLRLALPQLPHVVAVFWECAASPGHPNHARHPVTCL